MNENIDKHCCDCSAVSFEVHIRKILKSTLFEIFSKLWDHCTNADEHSTSSSFAQTMAMEKLSNAMACLNWFQVGLVAMTSEKTYFDFSTIVNILTLVH